MLIRKTGIAILQSSSLTSPSTYPPLNIHQEYFALNLATLYIYNFFFTNTWLVDKILMDVKQIAEANMKNWLLAGVCVPWSMDTLG